MDVRFFLEERTTFVRYYYDTAASAFLEIHRRIEAKEEPYNKPHYDESGEPPFMEEWSSASDGLVVLGRSTISMLKQAMQDYFDEWVSRFRIEKPKNFPKGMFPGFRMLFEEALGPPWSDSGANLELLEQVVLARNAEQHGTEITTIHAKHPDHDQKRFGEKLRFVSDMERRWRERKEKDEDHFPFFMGHVEVTREDLFEATYEFEKLVAWLEPLCNHAYYGHDAGPFPIKKE